MKYKAILVGVGGLERPVQSFGTDVFLLEKWAEGILLGLKPEQQKTAFVDIIEIREVLVKSITRKVAEK